MDTRTMGAWLWRAFALVFGIAALVEADESTHKYADGEVVKLYVNKVGPYNNPQETYNYYELPFCKPPEALGHKPKRKWGGLGEVLQGNELIDSEIQIQFKKNVDQQKKICSIRLGEKETQTFANAIKSKYWYEFFIDDLPVWGFVGEYPPGESQAYIFTHKNFEINYNNNRVVMVNLTAGELKPLVTGAEIDFTYSVKWVPTMSTYERRFERYLDHSFFQHQIHWFSIFNSFMMVIFLTGLVSMILMRTLKNDYAKYTKEEDDIELLERDVVEETGWKLVHGDVFRSPKNLTMLSALVGTGAQLSLLTLSIIFLAIVGALYFSRGAILTAFIVCYALTSVVSGYVGGSFYAQNGGKQWIQAMMLTASFFPGTCFGIAFTLNSVAIAYRSLAAVPFGTIVVVILLWSFISFPLTLFGTVIGRNWAGAPDIPCRIKRIPSPIPERKWYLKPWIVAMVGGLLPFGSIFIEMYFIFTSFWNYKVYYVYGFMLLVFLILVIVTVCVTIVGTYFLLNAENYHWQWTSFMTGVSTAFYVFLYSVHYFVAKTKMTGFFQTCFYFGYTLMFCLGLGIMCGAIGYLGSSQFVKRIYRNIKCD